jgi:hypothetical protein
MTAPPDEPGEAEPTPRLPRGRFFSRIRFMDAMRIGMFATLLIVVLVLRRPCADSVATFIDAFDGPPDAAPEVELRYERLTDEQIRERFGSADADAGPGPAGDD